MPFQVENFLPNVHAISYRSIRSKETMFELVAKFINFILHVYIYIYIKVNKIYIEKKKRCVILHVKIQNSYKKINNNYLKPF